nr:hypothetical protein [Tanacetum cinerariifolium]
MRKTMLKQQFTEFSVTDEEGLHKGYNRFQKILIQLNQVQAKPDNDDINMKFLRALPSSWSQVALELKTRDQDMIYEDFDQVDQIEMEELELKWHLAMLSLRINRYGMMAGLNGDHAAKGAASVSDAAAEFAIMRISPQVQNCPLGCDSKINDLNKMYNNLDRLYDDCYIKVQAYQHAVKTLESQKEWYHKTQIALEEKVKVLSFNLEDTTNTLRYTENLHVQAQKEKKEWEVKFEETFARFDKWKESSKNLNKLINSSIEDEVFDLSIPSTLDPEPIEKRFPPLSKSFVKAGEIHEVPPSITGTFMPTSYKSDLIETQ